MRLALLALVLACGSPPANARSIAHHGRQLDFDYAWPIVSPALPRLEAWLARDAAVAEKRARRQASETWARDRDDSGADPPRHGYAKKWDVAAATPRLLALSAASQVYTGGAHEGIAFDALMWDRKTDRPVSLADLFTAPRRALGAMERAYCAELKADQKERRGEGYREADFRCPALGNAPVVVTGTGRISGFEVLLQPYAAGSWAEGPYEVEVRFSPRLIALVKAEYRTSFARRR
jgi:hypothetical protein